MEGTKSRNGRTNQSKSRITSSVILALLLIAPGLAIYRLSPALGFGVPMGWFFCISIVTYVLYASDKKKAEAGQWRIPESTLHLSELIGGWPAAFIAQRSLRHKISKPWYQFVFWSIVLIHQYLTIDFVLDWKLIRSVLG